MALPGIIVQKKDENGNLVPHATVTYAQYVVTVIKGIKKGLDVALNELIEKNELQDQSIVSATEKAERGISDANSARSVANEAKTKAIQNTSDIGKINDRFGVVTKFNSGTATPTYSCADGEVYFQIKS